MTVAFAGALGLAWWFLALLVDVDPDQLMLFWPGTAVSVVLLVLLTPGDPRALSAPMGVLPLLVAGSTAPVGDDDGLWVAIFVELVVWTAILLALAIGAWSLKNWSLKKRSSKKRRPSPTRAAGHRSTRVLLAEALVVALTVTGVLWLRADALTGPWPDLQSRLSTYPVPTGFTTVGQVRHGSPRCSSSCTPELSLMMRGSLDLTTDCATLKQSLGRWSDTTGVADWLPIAAPDSDDWQSCAYVARHRRAGVTREIQAQVARQLGQPAEVTVTVVEECALTC